MKATKPLLIVWTLSAMLAACGKGDSGGDAVTPAPAPTPAPPVVTPSGPPPISGMYTYMFRDHATGCTTGRQSFGTLAEMCVALLDEARNANCARFLRETDHLMRCRGQGGTTTPVPVPTNPGLPGYTMRNVWCSIGGKDFRRDWSAFFNQRSNFRAILWNGNRRVSHALPFGAGYRYGEASVLLNPPMGGDVEGRTEVVLRQDGGRIYSVKGRLSHSTRLQVDDARQETSVLLDCGAMDPALAVEALAPQTIRCQITHRGSRGRTIEEKLIPWNGQSIHQETLKIGPGRRDNLDLRLLPAPAPDFAVAEIETSELDVSKRLYARGSLRGGFEFRHQDRRSSYDVQIHCAPQ